jgi:hypothetical protein
MSMADEIVLASAIVLPAADLGAPGPLDPAYCSAWALKALEAAAGDAMRLASFSLEMGSSAVGAGDAITVHVATDKRTHAIAFLSLEARAGAAVAFAARAVFSADHS